MRIASLSPAATEILFLLGRGGDVVVTDQFSNYPDDAKRIPKVRGHERISVDDLLTFQPELILTGTAVQEKLAAYLRSRGLSVTHQNPRSILEIYEAIRMLGTVLDAEAAAQSVILAMQQGFNAVKKKANLLPRKPTVYIEEWPALTDSSGRHNPPMVSGNWVPETLRIAGGVPFPLPPRALSREVTLDEVRLFNPDLIVISWCGAGSLAKKELLLHRPGWDSLRAVKAGHVRVIDDSLLNRPGPRLVEGAQHVYGWCFELLH